MLRSDATLWFGPKRSRVPQSKTSDSLFCIMDGPTCRLEVCGLRWAGCVPEEEGKDRGGGSGWRGVENGVEEELPVVEKINSLIDLLTDIPDNLPSLVPHGQNLLPFVL